MITKTTITARTIITTIVTTTMIVVLGSGGIFPNLVAVGVIETVAVSAVVVVTPTVKISILTVTRNHEAVWMNAFIMLQKVNKHTLK